MKTASKYIYLWVIQGNYGYGWDDVDQSDKWSEARVNLRAYRVNEPATPHRVIRRRELNTEAR